MISPTPRTLRIMFRLAVASLLLLAACGSAESDSASDAADAASATTATAAPAESELADTDEPAESGPDADSAWSQNAGALEPAQRDGLYRSVGAPPMMIDAGSPYEAVFSMAGGDMRFRLFADEAPLTVNNFVALADDGFFNGVTFHRVLPNFMAQGGDPAGTGIGGPGYTFANEYTPGIEFGARGLLAMANAGPDTNGSQFFITFEEAGFLEASQYTVFGELIEGDDVLGSISLRDPNAGGSPGDAMSSVTIERG